jgi:hypothetical protein
MPMFPFIALFEFLDNYKTISKYTVWLKDYIYEFVCPDCSRRGVAFIMLGALLVSVYIAISGLVLLWAVWKYKRWIPCALAVLYMTACIFDGVEKLYEYWWG